MVEIKGNITTENITANTSISSDSIKATKEIGYNSLFDNGTVTTNTNIDWNNSNVQKITLGANIDITFTNSSVIGFKMLIVKQDSTGGYKINNYPTIRWKDDEVPDISSSSGEVTFISLFFDGTDYYGSYDNGY